MGLHYLDKSVLVVANKTVEGLKMLLPNDTTQPVL